MIATALGGETVTTTVEGRERYGVNIRYPRDLRSSPENGELTTYIYVDITGRDLGGYVADAQKAVAEAVKLPPGYSRSSFRWGSRRP